MSKNHNRKVDLILPYKDIIFEDKFRVNEEFYELLLHPEKLKNKFFEIVRETDPGVQELYFKGLGNVEAPVTKEIRPVIFEKLKIESGCSSKENFSCFKHSISFDGHNIICISNQKVFKIPHLFFDIFHSEAVLIERKLIFPEKENPIK